MLYSAVASVEILNFSHRFNLEYFISRIFYLPRYYRGYKRIDKGLLVAANYVFTKSRPGVPKVAILTTNGKLTPVPDAIPLANASRPLKQQGVRIFAVGVGRNVAIQELLEITERREDVILVKNFFHLLVFRFLPKILLAIGKHGILYSNQP